MVDFRAARRGLDSAVRALARAARIVTALLFLPLLLFFLKMVDPGPLVWESLNGQGRAVLGVIVMACHWLLSPALAR